MAPSKQSKPAESDGEEFNSVDGSDLDSDEELQIGDDTLNWVCPTIGPQAKRNDFEAVGHQVHSRL